jgi:hypothetical protein
MCGAAEKISDAALAELVRLDKEATQPPFEVRQRFYIGVPGDIYSLAEMKSCTAVPADKEDEHAANAALFVAMRNAIGALIARLQAAEAELQALRAELEKAAAEDAQLQAMAMELQKESLQEQSKAARAAGG